MKVVEKFISINGEGRRAGELAVFIRFKGCNLNCSYCDTKGTNEPACDYEELSPDKICEYVSETGIKNVTLTGGGLYCRRISGVSRKKLLNKIGHSVIETNGRLILLPCQCIFKRKFRWITRSSCEEKMLLSNMEV